MKKLLLLPILLLIFAAIPANAQPSLFDVRPDDALDDLSDRYIVKIEDCAKFSKGQPFSLAPAANLSDDFSGYFRGGIVLASKVGLIVSSIGSLPPFRVPVVVVIGQRSKEEVTRVATRRIVALVANAHPFGNRAVSQFPGDAMRALGTLGVVYDQSVALVAFLTFPNPAVAGLVHFLPKTISERPAVCAFCTLMAASFCFSDAAWDSLKFDAANRTGQFDGLAQSTLSALNAAIFTGAFVDSADADFKRLLAVLTNAGNSGISLCGHVIRASNAMSMVDAA